jgi:hydroxyethylthiazole kinase-like uncharacterized protein yjeF
MPPEPISVTARTLREWPLPEAGSDKVSRGELLVVGGGGRTPGAVLLAGEAALRAGAGKLRMATAGSVLSPLAVAVPEAMVIPLPERHDGALDGSAAEAVVDMTKTPATVLLGPGLSDVDAAVELLSGVVPRLETHVVVDGLASGYVTENPDGLAHLRGRCLLTVNPTELSRVLHRDEDEVAAEPHTAALDAARRTGAVVVCGGTSKHIACPEGRCWVVRAGGPGLGVSGSGDVQAGLVAGLLARGAEPPQAAVWGAYLHATAGDRLAATVGTLGFLARELSGQVPAILDELAS